MDSLTLRRHNSFQNQNNRKATHGFAPTPLTFKLQQEVSKIFSPKTDLLKNFLYPETRSFENVSIVTFKEVFDFPLFNNLFISFLNVFISLTELKNIY